jgi:hypothetical protein
MSLVEGLRQRHILDRDAERLEQRDLLFGCAPGDPAAGEFAYLAHIFPFKLPDGCESMNSPASERA